MNYETQHESSMKSSLSSEDESESELKYQLETPIEYLKSEIEIVNLTPSEFEESPSVALELTISKSSQEKKRFKDPL